MKCVLARLLVNSLDISFLEFVRLPSPAEFPILENKGHAVPSIVLGEP